MNWKIKEYKVPVIYTKPTATDKPIKKEKWIYLKYSEKLFADPKIVNKGLSEQGKSFNLKNYRY